jgi:hypothetical protein
MIYKTKIKRNSNRKWIIGEFEKQYLIQVKNIIEIEFKIFWNKCSEKFIIFLKIEIHFSIE